MGKPKLMKNGLRQMIEIEIEKYIVASEARLGKAYWDGFREVEEVVKDFAGFLTRPKYEQNPPEEEEEELKRKFEIGFYKDVSSSSKETPMQKYTIEATTAVHARVLFLREYPNALIVQEPTEVTTFADHRGKETVVSSSEGPSANDAKPRVVAVQGISPRSEQEARAEERKT
jgi:hypothetical protein